MKRSFTLIELVVTIVIIGILGATSAGMIASVTELFVYVPNYMKAITIANEIIDIMVEGDQIYQGLRFMNYIEGVSYTSDATKLNGIEYRVGYPTRVDKKRIEYFLTGGRIVRQHCAYASNLATVLQDVLGSPEEILYYWHWGDFTVSGPHGEEDAIFKLYDQSGNLVTDTYNATYIKIQLRVTVGNASYETVTGVQIKQDFSS